MNRIFSASLIASLCFATNAPAADPEPIKKELLSFFEKCDANSNGLIDISERTKLREHVNAALLDGDEIHKLGKVPLAPKPGAASKPMLTLLKLRVGKENPD